MHIEELCALYFAQFLMLVGFRNLLRLAKKKR